MLQGLNPTYKVIQTIKNGWANERCSSQRTVHSLVVHAKWLALKTYITLYTLSMLYLKSVYVYAYLYTYIHRDIHKYMYAITISEERGQVFEGNWET